MAPGADGLAAYRAERWPWASGEGRWPVDIEEFARGADAAYSEHYAANEGARAVIGDLMPCTAAAVTVQQLRSDRCAGAQRVAPSPPEAMERVGQALRPDFDL
ncbi:hypothetical protein GCM10010277_77020 [Streptomyces longisporoflavus]|uniref:hypothetical protein n=1 Tax=Streptomyces longisporoflavus TaxID=28044 RepID=UPI00167E42E6|nr:hypothetical protein [Streptomyces longisporoflavus]GGV68028.1 hypothetical protein GCM10010277_77020 [Streptomyces longisporoflavus]